MRRYCYLTVTLLALLLISYWHDTTPFLEHHVTLAPGFSASLFARDLDRPTNMAFAPDGRLFVTEESGAVRIIKNGILLAQPFLTLDVSLDVESGLLQVAFDPHFEQNQWLYLYYTTSTTPPRDRLIRVTAQGDVAEPNSQITLWETGDFPSSDTHRGGAIAFDADDFLYLSVGDGNDSTHSQRLDTIFGKILRLTRNGKPAPNNPFLQTPGARPEIYAYGLRNTFTFARDANTGMLYMDDVGENDWEEINLLTRGANYGWATCEGKCVNKTKGLTDPVFTYAHKMADLSGCAITGGTFYHPPQVRFPSKYLNQYFYTDLCGGWIRVLNLATGVSEPFATGLTFPVGLQVGPDGALYVLSHGGGKTAYQTTVAGEVWRIQYNATEQPVENRNP